MPSTMQIMAAIEQKTEAEPKQTKKPGQTETKAEAIADGLEMCAEPFERLGARTQAAALRRGAVHARNLGGAATRVTEAAVGLFDVLAKIIPPGKSRPR